MGKFLRRVFSLVGVIMMWSLITSPPATAWIEPPNDPKRPLTWWQGDARYARVSLGFNGYPTSDTVQASGCAQFAYVASLRKSRTVPDTYNIDAVREDNARMLREGKQGAFLADGQFVNHPVEMTKALTEGKVEHVTYVDNKTCKDANWLKGQLKDGEYFGFMGVKGQGQDVNGHWIAIDYIDDEGKVHVADSGWTGTVHGENPHYGGSNPCIYSLSLFRMADGTKAKDLPHFDDTKSSGPPSENKDGEKVDLGEGILTDKYLEGMPPPTKGEQIRIDSAVGIETPPQYFPLAAHQKQNIKDLQETLTAEKTLSYYSVFRAAIAFVGIFLYLYSVLFLIAYAMDRSYTESGTFTRLISFNRMSVRSDSEMVEEDKDGKKYLTWPQAVLISFGIAVLASLMVSGVLVKWVSSLIVFIADGI